MEILQSQFAAEGQSQDTAGTDPRQNEKQRHWNKFFTKLVLKITSIFLNAYGVNFKERKNVFSVKETPLLVLWVRLHNYWFLMYHE